MLDATIVLNRLKLYLNVKTDLQLSTLLKVKPNTITSWKKRNSLQFESIIDICEINEIDLNELFYGINRLKTVQNNDDVEEKTGVKMITSDLQFQYLLEAKTLMPNMTPYYFPFLEQCEIAFQVITENMTPTIGVSTFVICQRVALEQLVEGRIYVLVKNKKGIFIMRFKAAVNEYELAFTNDNSSFRDKIIKTDRIGEYWEVKGTFSATRISL